MESAATSGVTTIIRSSSVGECMTVQAGPRGRDPGAGVMTGRRSGTGQVSAWC